jgi:hypothetical protein
MAARARPAWRLETSSGLLGEAAGSPARDPVASTCSDFGHGRRLLAQLSPSPQAANPNRNRNRPTRQVRAHSLDVAQLVPARPSANRSMR